MSILALIAMLAYLLGGSVYGFLYGFDTRLITQLGICGVGAVLLLCFYGAQWIKKPKKEAELPMPNGESKEMNDFISLQYLKTRAEEMGSEEMLRLLSELNTLMFDFPNKKEKDSE